MISYIGIGSNLGPREELISKAIDQIKKLEFVTSSQTSYTYENPALVCAESKDDWDKTFLNLVLKIETYPSLGPEDLLTHLKKIESSLGRDSNLKWSARPIDLDILHIEGKNLKSETLEVPHKSLHSRNFVTAPLRDLASSMKINGDSILNINRKVKNPLPLWMAIANITPDSFSDGGELQKVENFKRAFHNWSEQRVHIVDVGAESTRPEAQTLSTEEEINRLFPVLEFYKKMEEKKIRRPKLSVDSRNFNTLRWALDYKPAIINDVSGLDDLRILDLLADSDCKYILMHSLSVPADPRSTLSENLPTVLEIKNWLEPKLEHFDKKNISLDRIIFDPGIGFGKTPRQSIELIREIESFKDCGLKILAGHSRKSFMKSFAGADSKKRDSESVGLSLALAEKGVDYLRVHNPEIHMKTHLGFLYGN